MPPTPSLSPQQPRDPGHGHLAGAWNTHRGTWTRRPAVEREKFASGALAKLCIWGAHGRLPDLVQVGLSSL